MEKKFSTLLEVTPYTYNFFQKKKLNPTTQSYNNHPSHYIYHPLKL